MLDYKNIFTSHVDNIKQEGRYRKFAQVKRLSGKFPYAWHSEMNKEVVMWCINDYLGMSQHQAVLKAAFEALKLNGLGSGGTRNIGGNNDAIVELENEIADLHQKESALAFTSGYVANEAALSSLAKIMPDIVFFSDELNHASIIAGLRNSKAEKHIYRHVDSNHLEELLKTIDINRPKLIVFESAYSMDGLISPLPDICALAKKYNALTYIDEVHSVGLYGKGGAGIANMFGLDDEIDIIQGTFGKAYGTIGGYIAGNKTLIDAVRLTAPGFIFTTSLPPVITSAATASIRHLKNSELERLKHQEVICKLKQSFKDAGVKYFENESHIVPIIIGDPIKAKEASELLLNDYGVYIQHINFPTVARGTERLRITPTPAHTDEMIEDLTKALVEVLRKLQVEDSLQVA